MNDLILKREIIPFYSPNPYYMNNQEKIPGLEINLRTGLYQIRENRVTYNFQQEMMISLENYLSKVEPKENTSLINSWYKSLPKYERQNIIINGGLEI